MFGRFFIAVAIFVATFAIGLGSRTEAAIMVSISATSSVSDELPAPIPEKPVETELDVLVANPGSGNSCTGAESNSSNMGSSVPGFLSPAACLLVADELVGLATREFRNVKNTAPNNLLEPPKFTLSCAVFQS